MGRRPAPIALALSMLVLAALPQAASALCSVHDYHVTTTADVVNASDGVLSLREAVNAADADPNTGVCEDIHLPAGHYTVSAGTLDLTPTSNLIYIAPESDAATARDVTIDGGGSSQLLHAGTGSQVQISRVTLENGLRAFVNDGTATIDNATLRGNHASGNGGAILNNAGGQLYLEQSTLSDDHASAIATPAAGGAVANFGLLDVGTDTLVGDSASGTRGSGGAIYNNGTMTISHSTLNGNSTTSISLPGGGGPDVFNESGKTAQTQDSIFGSGCNVALTPVGAEGLSVGSDTTCVSTTGDLRLGPLQDNGGGTDTEMLLAGSAALDTYTLQCQFDRDQRGVNRPQGAKCDSGAYELVQSDDAGIVPDVPSVTVAQGATVTLPFHVAASAPSDASLVNELVRPTVTSVLPAGLSFVSGSPGCGATGQTVTCAVGPTHVNATAVPVTLDVRADAAGSFQDTAGVSIVQPDTNALDDQASIAITSTAPPVPPQARLAFAGRPKVTGDRVRFTLVCSDAPCAGNARILTTERLRRHRVVGLRQPARSAATRTLSLARTTFSIAAGRRATLTLRLGRTGRALLKRFHRLPARLNLRLGTSKTTAASATVVFKRRR